MTQAASVTGKANVWASFNAWLALNVPAGTTWTYNFDQALDPAVMPRVDVSEFKYFDPGDTALGGYIFPANLGSGPTQGKRQRMMVELNIRTDGSQSTSALQLLRQIRDWLIYALQNAGVTDEDTATLLMPCILINDSLGHSTNIVARVVTEEDNAIVENYFPPAAPETLIHRYQILFRLEWFEMR